MRNTGKGGPPYACWTRAAKLADTLPPTAWSQVLAGAKPLEADDAPALDLDNPRDVALCTLAAGVAREGGGADRTEYWEERMATAAGDARAGLALVQDTAADYAALARAAAKRPDGLRYMMLLGTVNEDCEAKADDAPAAP